jgi:hypothetical protein
LYRATTCREVKAADAAVRFPRKIEEADRKMR